MEHGSHHGYHGCEGDDDRQDYDADLMEWTDPNLTEPKLQDDLNRRLTAAPLSRRQRPRAARPGWKSAPEEVAQIRYFKYVPYSGMSQPDRQKYLSLGPARLTSSRTEPTPRRRVETPMSPHGDVAAASFWPSASKTKSLRVYDYHLAELSLAYRSPPDLLAQPRRLATPSTQQEGQQRRPKSLFYQIHRRRVAPASAPSATEQQLQEATLAEKTTQVSRGGTPFIDSAMSDHFPTEPSDVVSKSESNRLLNVVSVDECHVRLRRRRRRLRRLSAGRTAVTAPGDHGDGADQEGDTACYDEEGEEEEGEDGDWEEEEGAEHSEEAAKRPEEQHVPVSPQPEPSAEQQQQQPDQIDAILPAAGAASTVTRPSADRRKAKRRTAEELRQVAAAKFLRRNEILREKMSIYLDWKLNQERLGDPRDLRQGDAGSRFERFTVELVQQEALVANQYRGGSRLPPAGSRANDNGSLASPRLAMRHHGEMSLTEMYEALKV